MDVILACPGAVHLSQPLPPPMWDLLSSGELGGLKGVANFDVCVCVISCIIQNDVTLT